MWELKEMFDPEYVLNPGVILNKASRAFALCCAALSPPYVCAPLQRLALGPLSSGRS